MPLRFTNQLMVPRESAHLPLCPRQASSAETLGPDDRRHPHALPSRPEGFTVGAGGPHPDSRASLSGRGGPHPDLRASLSGQGVLIQTQGSHCRGWVVLIQTRGSHCRGGWSSSRPEGLTVGGGWSSSRPEGLTVGVFILQISSVSCLFLLNLQTPI